MRNLSIEVDFDRFPPEHTCDGGENISPPAIRVRGSDAPYLAVIVDDPDAPRGGTFTHWLVWNIPSTEIPPEGIPPEPPRVSRPVAAVQGTNDFRRIGYAGPPCPPRKGASHRFFLRVWSVERELDIPPPARAVPHLRTRSRPPPPATGETMATYERRKVFASTPGAGTRT
ncbi:YbhB/YbcL family Raf kinase inhibitor-like protein [Methanoculleus chikugoensis]|uniref:YbhB/YbcL family Raf kinase inhibitor-like protein n=1 Tax=Methanoculleus chikugoensis TaxID=118126 RepID=UPI0006D236E2|nr:YbhB/YbcL family Raf kinase inhibitor-like protein [Methanoculleus chikugoensis]